MQDSSSLPPVLNGLFKKSAYFRVTPFKFVQLDYIQNILNLSKHSTEYAESSLMVEYPPKRRKMQVRLLCSAV